jgi:hypothetical protein
VACCPHQYYLCATPGNANRLQKATPLADALHSYQAPPNRLLLEDNPPHLFVNKMNKNHFLENLLSPFDTSGTDRMVDGDDDGGGGDGGGMPDSGSHFNLRSSADEREGWSSVSCRGSLPPPYEDVVKATCTPLQPHDSHSLDIPTVSLGCASDAGSVHRFKRTDCSDLDMMGPLSVESPVVGYLEGRT